MVALHAEQCIEKAFKALIEERGGTIVKTHDLKKLFDLVALDVDFSVDETTLNELSTLYVESRYPGDMALLPYGKPTLEDARRFHQFAKEIFDKIETILEDNIQERGV